ncbi:MAG: hypothetical protein ACC655_10520 [Rhodothermia bacterium]
MIAAGADLIRDLDERGFRPMVVFWLYFSEKERWKLAIGDEIITKGGDRDVYHLVLTVLEEAGDRLSALTLEDIAVFPDYAPVVGRLESVISRFPELDGVRLDNAGIDGMLIEGAYVYQLDKARAQAETG